MAIHGGDAKGAWDGTNFGGGRHQLMGASGVHVKMVVSMHTMRIYLYVSPVWHSN